MLHEMVRTTPYSQEEKPSLRRSTPANGYCGNISISDDGRYVTFYSTATNLDASVTDNNGFRDAFLRDRVAGTTTLISKAFGTSTSADKQTYATDLTVQAVNNAGQRQVYATVNPFLQN